MKISTKHFTTSENAQNIVIVGNENETLFSDAANLSLDKNSVLEESVREIGF